MQRRWFGLAGLLAVAAAIPMRVRAAVHEFVYGLGDPYILHPANPDVQAAFPGWQGACGHRIAYRASPYNPAGYVYSPNIVDAEVPAGSRAFEWARLVRLTNRAGSDGGENVADYAQGFKYGQGPTWGRCTEVQDFSGQAEGLVCAEEINVLAAGPDRALGDNRMGHMFVFGNVAPSGPRAIISYAACFYAKGNDRAKVALRNLHRVGIDCIDGVWRFDAGVKAPQLFDLRGTEIPLLLKLSGTSSMFSPGPVAPGQWIAHMVKAVEINGEEFYLPLYTKGTR